MLFIDVILMSDVFFRLNVKEDHVGQNLINVTVFFGGEELQMFSKATWNFD